MMTNIGLQRVILGIFAVLGLILTFWRIYFRLRIGRFWWEDAWATAAFFTGLVWSTVELSVSDDFNSYGTRDIIEAWIYTVTFNLLIIMVRMSILYSIIRLVNKGSAILNSARCVAAFILSSGITLMAIKIWRCASTTTWHHNVVAHGGSYCSVDLWFAIIEIVIDMITVAILVVLPLRMLWRIKLPSRQRRMILSIFASSILLAVASLFHTIGRLSSDFLSMTTGLNLEVVLSLFICNLLVIVTYTYRYLLHKETDSADTTTALSTRANTSEGTDSDDDFTRPTRYSHSFTSHDISLTTISLESYTTRTSSWTRNETSSDRGYQSPLPSPHLV